MMISRFCTWALFALLAETPFGLLERNHQAQAKQARSHQESLGAHQCQKIQYNFPPWSGDGDVRATAIKQAYLDVWNEYEKYAFGYDDLLPVSKGSADDFYGWSLTIVDGLDTAIVMGLTEVVDKQLARIAMTDFSISHALPDIFDVTIRYIGGLLGAYDLIMHHKAPNTNHYNQSHVAALLDGAQTLGNLLKPCFDSPTGIPYFEINTTTHKAVNSAGGGFPFYDPIGKKTYFSNVTNVAVAGTLILEFHRLSDLTGDESFRQLADKAETYLINPSPPPIYPGLVGSELYIPTGEFFGKDTGWQSGIDSFYEYLIKSAIYNPAASTAAPYQDFWISAAESTEKHLAVHPFGHPELTFITQLNATGAPEYAMDDYACFAGGNLLLGGAYLGRPDISALGLAVTDSCHALYNATPAGLNPHAWAWYSAANETGPSYQNVSHDRAFFDAKGFFPLDNAHMLYPEPIESVMYAWRITGDKKWQEYAWEMFQALENCGHRGGSAMTPVWDVMKEKGGDQWDLMPSYYLAETLKYLYLTFSDPALVSLDEFVYNTEAHPLKVLGGQCEHF